MSSTITDRKLKFTLDGASGLPFYRQIIQEIEHAILAGRIAQGERLPTIRSLAIELKMNPNTIAKAYAELEMRGIVTTQVGSGTFVSEKRIQADSRERDDAILNILARCTRELETLGITKAEIPGLFQSFEEDSK
jgi:GntR family transcriptional regulator